MEWFSEGVEWFRENLWGAWLSLGVLLGVAELFSLDLILIMLAVGSFAGMLTALLGLPFAVQAIAAAAASVAMLALVRPSVAKRLHGGPELRLGHGKLVGREAVVTEAISTHQVGRVKLAGEIWSAQAYDGSLAIAAGETVEVFEIRGATVFVHPVPSIES